MLLILYHMRLGKSSRHQQRRRARHFLQRSPSRHTAGIPSSALAFFATSYNNILYTRSYTLGSELVESAPPAIRQRRTLGTAGTIMDELTDRFVTAIFFMSHISRILPEELL